MSVIYGYGVDSSKVSFSYAQNSYEYLADLVFNHNCKPIREDFNDYLKEEEIDYDNLSENEQMEVWADYVDMFDAYDLDESSEGTDELGMLAYYINNMLFGGKLVFQYEDGCLFVEARIPVDEADKKFMPTQKDIQQILALYLNPMLRHPVTVDHIEIYD